MPHYIPEIYQTFSLDWAALKVILLSEVLKRTGYSKAWVYALMSRGQFPQSVKIGARAIAFIESEIDDWIDQRIAESRSN
ncbi:TPA: AlpA family transcriptional regulator [Escherichia coli]|nr:AlpA family transcriptional regulator [Escherichia coli]MCV9100911.1 AlpA family transcriptional regulator [Escherichia coli]HAO1938994.1 AlpA family transcriptional regulator [Escherichia coli]